MNLFPFIEIMIGILIFRPLKRRGFINHGSTLGLRFVEFNQVLRREMQRTVHGAWAGGAPGFLGEARLCSKYFVQGLRSWVQLVAPSILPPLRLPP